MYQIILFWNDTLHDSEGLSVHHQEFKTVFTATGICQTDTAVCLLAGTQIQHPTHQVHLCVLYAAGHNIHSKRTRHAFQS